MSSLELRHGHLVIDLVRVAPVGAVHRRVRERRLDVHHGLGFGGGFRGIVAHQLEHVRHVLEILPAQLLRLVVVVAIILAVRQTESALLGLGDHLRAVLEILLGPKIEDGVRALRCRRATSACNPAASLMSAMR